MDKAHLLQRPDNPLPCCFIAFEFKCCQGADRGRLNFPERTSLIVRAELAIADAIPPSTCLAPSRKHCMDTKTFTAKGEFNGGKTSIGKNIVGWYDVRCCWLY
jgi:hypothetical protein